MPISPQQEKAQLLHTSVMQPIHCLCHGHVLLAAALLCFLLAQSVNVLALEAQGAEEQTLTIEEIDQLFDEAMKSLEQQDLQTARKRFENILSGNPSLHRARLELARVYYLSFDYEKARAETLRVLDDPNTPPQVRVTLLAFLAQIDADQKQLNKAHRWGGSIYLGLTYDSNVNAGPDQTVIDLNGTSLSLTDASLERSDVGLSLIAGITHNYSPGVTFDFGEQSGFFLWQSQANLNLRPYFNEDDFNVAVLTLRTGPSWIVPRHWRAGIALQLDKLWLGNEALALFTSLNPSIVWQRAENWEFGLDLVYTQRSYDDQFNKPRDGDFIAATATVSKYLEDPEVGLQAGIGYEDFSADDTSFSHSGPNVFVGANKSMWDNGSIYARVNWRDYDYDGLAPFFNTPRDDLELRLTVGFQRALAWQFLEDWQLLGSVSVADNSSNVPIFDYDRQLFNLGVSRSF